MSIPCKLERSLLSHEEHETVQRSHHPVIYDQDLDELQSLLKYLRNMRDRERTFARAKRREARGKGPARGGTFPGTAERPYKRKQVLVAALKRVSKEISRRSTLNARATQAELANRALAMRRAAQFPPRPAAGYAANEGMRSLPSQRRRTKLPPAKIGSVSQATKNAQAVRDARN